jgi:prevent-host-death family protein
MARNYSTYEAKARFSEILRSVRAGQRVIVTYHGREVAEIRPLERTGDSFERRLERLEAEGTIVPSTAPVAKFGPLARRPGALGRFLNSRD